MDISGELQKIHEQAKAVQVDRAIPLSFELGLLSAFDLNPLDTEELNNTNHEERDKYLMEHSRGGVQLLLNEIFSLPTVGTDMGFMATLPKPTYILPREKPVPKVKATTRWEKFAKAKGIQKRKRERMVYDEATGEYKPRYGLGGINQVSEDWLMEVPDNVKAGDEEDQYEAAKKAKKDRVAKNEKQRVRNLKEAAGIKDIHHVPKSKDTTEKQAKDSKEAAEKRLKKAERKVEAEKSMHLAGLSTASMGRFDKKLEGEPKLKGIKRKFEATVTDSKQEKDSSLRIADKVVNGKYDPVKAKKEKNSKLVNVRKAIKANKSKE